MQNKQALIIIDMINDFHFKHGKQLLQATKDILPNILHMKKYANAHNLPIIYVNDHYRLWKADLNLIYQHCLNKDNKQVLEAILPEKDDYFLIKPKHSGFHQTALQALLAELHVKEVILTGIAGNICVLFTANDAYMREYKLAVPSDCTASNDFNDNKYALLMMENVLQADVTPSSAYSNHNY